MDETIEKRKFESWYNKNYKKLLLIPLILILLSFSYIGYFYFQNNDFINKDVSLTGGTTITLFTNNININDFRDSLSQKITDFSIRELSDFRTGEQQAIVIESPLEETQLKPLIEDITGYQLNSENSTIEFSGSTLSENFYKQLIYAIILSFSFMAIVVFFIFGGSNKIKALSIFLTLIPIILFFSRLINVNIAIILNLIVLLINSFFYFKQSIPSIVVVLSAFADILMTLALVDFFNLKLSSAGIIAFLMLIGYSVDTDIMLTTRLLKRREDKLDTRLFNAFKTGITMTLTSISAIGVALLLTYSFSNILGQIFTILLIGLGFDLINTWITNASLLKWYLENENRN